jgi:hypothetical protein
MPVMRGIEFLAIASVEFSEMKYISITGFLYKELGLGRNKFK